MAQRTGRVTVKTDSLGTLRSMPGATLQIGGVQREGEMTDQGVFIYSEKNTPSMVKCEMPHMSDTDLSALRGFNGGTVSYETDTGVVFTVSNAVVTEVGELTNGKVSVTFMGDPAQGG